MSTGKTSGWLVGGLGVAQQRRRTAGRPRKSPADEPTWQRILDAAEQLFAKGGFRGTSLADIAHASEIHAPSVLIYHFGSKEGLFAAVAERVFERAYAEVEQARHSTGSPAERLAATLDAVLSYADAHRAILVRILSEAVAEGPFGAELEETVKAILDVMEQSLREAAVPSIPPDAPLRDALMDLSVAYLARASLSQKLPSLWSEANHTAKRVELMLRAFHDWQAHD